MPKPTRHFDVHIDFSLTSQVRRKIAKRNIFTFRNLPPGSYSAMY